MVAWNWRGPRCEGPTNILKHAFVPCYSSKCVTDIRTGTRQLRHPRNILLMKTNRTFTHNIVIKRTLASIYPNKRLVYSFNTARAEYTWTWQHRKRLTLYYEDRKLRCLEGIRPLWKLVIKTQQRRRCKRSIQNTQPRSSNSSNENIPSRQCQTICQKW